MPTLKRIALPLTLAVSTLVWLTAAPAQPAPSTFTALDPRMSESEHIGKTYVVMFEREHCKHPNTYSILPTPSAFDTRRMSSSTPQSILVESMVKGLEGSTSRYFQVRLKDESLGFIDAMHFRSDPDTPDNLLRKGCTLAGDIDAVRSRISEVESAQRQLEQSRIAAEEKQRQSRIAAEEKQQAAVLAAERRRAEQAKRPGARIGMTAKEVVERTNWGDPQSVNRTVTAGGIREQWVYGTGEYLYFVNGRLQAIQSSTR